MCHEPELQRQDEIEQGAGMRRRRATARGRGSRSEQESAQGVTHVGERQGVPGLEHGVRDVLWPANEHHQGDGFPVTCPRGRGTVTASLDGYRPRRRHGRSSSQRGRSKGVRN